MRRQVQPINDIPRPVYKLAFRFLKEWAGARRHGDRYGGPVAAGDRPQLARTIAAHISLGTLPNDRSITELFVRGRSSLPWRDLMMLFGKS